MLAEVPTRPEEAIFRARDPVPLRRPRAGPRANLGVSPDTLALESLSCQGGCPGFESLRPLHVLRLLGHCAKSLRDRRPGAPHPARSPGTRLSWANAQ